MILMSFLYLNVSESSLYKSQFHSFQNDISTITASLEESTLISIQWLSRIEARNDYTIYVIDNGIPFLYNMLHTDIDSRSQNLLSESLDAYYAMFEIYPSENTSGDTAFDGTASDHTIRSSMASGSATSAAASGSAYSGIWHTEYEFRSPSAKETYYCSLIDIEKNNTISQIVILCSLRRLRMQVVRQRIIFLGINFIAVVILSIFSWLFTGRLLKPLQENHESQTQFIAAASHELRTPLSVILASSECCESASADEQKSFFQTIRKEGKRMNSLIDDMLLLAHSGMNRFPIERAPVQLDTLCLNAYEAFEPLCQSKNLTLLLTLPEEPIPRCNCDNARIAQVLSILLHNAVSYTPQDGQISLSLTWNHYAKKGTHDKDAAHANGIIYSKGTNCDKERLHSEVGGIFEITVTDTGIGISDTDKKHIFERFYRVEKSRNTKGHFGLGLSIAYEIVAAHHGKISVRDNPAGGSVFVVKLT